MVDDPRRAHLRTLLERARLARLQAESVAYNTGWSDDAAEDDLGAAVRAFDQIGVDDLPLLDELASDPSAAIADDAKGEARRIRTGLSAERLGRHLSATAEPEASRYARAFLDAPTEDRTAVDRVYRAWAKRPELHAPTLRAMMDDLPRLEAAAPTIEGVVRYGAAALLQARQASLIDRLLDRDPPRTLLMTLLDQHDVLAREVALAVFAGEDSERRRRLVAHIRSLGVERRRAIARGVGDTVQAREVAADCLVEDDDPTVRLEATRAANGAVSTTRLLKLIKQDPDEPVRVEAALWLERKAWTMPAAQRAETLSVLRTHAMRVTGSRRAEVIASASRVRLLVEGEPKLALHDALARLDTCVAALGTLDPPTEADVASLEDLAVAVGHLHEAHDGTSLEVARALVTLLYHPAADVFAPLLGLSRRTAAMKLVVPEAIATSIARERPTGAYREPMREDPAETAFRARLLRHVGVQLKSRGYGIDAASAHVWLADPSEDVRMLLLELAAPVATARDWDELAEALGDRGTERITAALRRLRPPDA